MGFSYSGKNLVLRSSSPTGANVTFDLEFQVKWSDVDTPTTNVTAVYTWLLDNLPWTLSDYGLASARLQEFTADPEDANEGKTFSGRATYAIKSGSSGFSDDTTSDDATHIRFNTNTVEVPVTAAYDQYGNWIAVTNSALCPYADPPTEPEKRTVINIEKTYSWGDMDPVILNRFINSVNVEPIIVAQVPIIARGGCILNAVPVVRNRGDGTYDWRVSYTIEVRSEGKTYDREFLDKGYHYLVETTSDDPQYVVYYPSTHKYYRRERVMVQNPYTGEYEPSDEPVLLDGAGGILAANRPPVYLKYRTKWELPWSWLNLPTVVRG